MIRCPLLFTFLLGLLCAGSGLAQERVQSATGLGSVTLVDFVARTMDIEPVTTRLGLEPARIGPLSGFRADEV